MKYLSLLAFMLVFSGSIATAESPIRLAGEFDPQAGTKDRPRSELTLIASWPTELGMLACESVELERLATAGGDELPVDGVRFEESTMSLFKRAGGRFLVEATLPAGANGADALALAGAMRIRAYSRTVTQRIRDLGDLIGQAQALGEGDDLWLTIWSIEGTRVEVSYSQAVLPRIAEVRFLTADGRELRVVNVGHRGIQDGAATLSYDLGAPRDGGGMAPLDRIDVDLIGGRSRELVVPFAIDRLPGNGDETPIPIDR